ncbi:MAG: DUF4845 domain-containing protein [Rhodocyclales bacterium]|nr:DUF4845 domain-containing protein [Rhodocyclales bacterium]
MNKQRGVALSGLLFWAVILSMVALLGMKVVPSYMEFFKIKKDAKATVAQSSPDATVADIRRTFDRFAQVDNLEFKASDLEISKDGGRIVIEFSYDKKVPLFANASLLIEYRGTTAE